MRHAPTQLPNDNKRYVYLKISSTPWLSGGITLHSFTSRLVEQFSWQSTRKREFAYRAPTRDFSRCRGALAPKLSQRPQTFSRCLLHDPSVNNYKSSSVTCDSCTQRRGEFVLLFHKKPSSNIALQSHANNTLRLAHQAFCCGLCRRLCSNFKQDSYQPAQIVNASALASAS